MAPEDRGRLGALFSSLGAAGGAVHVTLSNRLVRYLCLPWSSALRSDADWRSFAEHRLIELFGTPAGGQALLLSAAAGRSARLACAVDRQLIAQVRESLAASGQRLASLRPRFAVAFDGVRRRMGESGWFVDHEPGQLTLALTRHGEWCAIRQRQADAAWRERLAQTLERECQLAGAGAFDRALVASSEASEIFSVGSA